MASCTCHVLCVTKRRRLERIVRRNATTKIGVRQALGLGWGRSQWRPGAPARDPSPDLAEAGDGPSGCGACQWPSEDCRDALSRRACNPLPKLKDAGSTVADHIAKKIGGTTLQRAA